MIAYISNSSPNLFPAFATLIVGLAVAFIAYQQWLVARNKFKLDLFEKRYKVYDATRCFLSVILRQASFEDKDLFEYYAGISDATFLYPQKVITYLNLIKTRALNMRSYARQCKDIPVEAEKTKLVEKEHCELKWLNDQMGELREVFHPYLGFSQIH